MNAKNNYDVKVYLVNGDPVGVALRNGKHISVFVRKKHRKLGIGTELIKAMHSHPEKLYAGDGIVGSDYFFRRNGVFV